MDLMEVRQVGWEDKNNSGEKNKIEGAIVNGETLMGLEGTQT